MELAKSFTHANRHIKVYYDPEPFNPRKEWDNLTTITHWHRRYDLGTEVPQSVTCEELVIQAQDYNDPILAILPLYLFDHSGLSVSTEAFSCRWDSGQVGWIYVTKSSAHNMGCEGAVWDTARYELAIKEEVKTYDAYLTGKVFGYVVEGKDGEALDSSWGYVGDLEGCESDAKLAAESSEDPCV